MNTLNKDTFNAVFQNLLLELKSYALTSDGQWAIKGFIDMYSNIYPISTDTKIISKVLEIHLFPRILEFAYKNNYLVVCPDHQNYYPDLSFINKENQNIKFAVDLKTTYRKTPESKDCNGFTLGSHGAYFLKRDEKKNIQFPYNQYLAHFCLGIIYDRNNIPDKYIYKKESLADIKSVIKNLQFFFVEKWKIASDKSGSGNTANIGSIKNIDNIINGKGTFSDLGEHIFDDYWINYNKISITDSDGKLKRITNLKDFLKYRGK